MFMTRGLLALTIAAMIVVGCKKEEPVPAVEPAADDDAPSTNMLGVAGDKLDDAVDAAKDTADDVTDAAADLAGDAMADMRKQYAAQLEDEQSKVSALKSTAQTFADDKLNGLLGNLDGQLLAAREKLNALANADEGSSVALLDELKTIMGKVGAYYEQATARLSELQAGGVDVPADVPEVPGLGGDEPEK